MKVLAPSLLIASLLVGCVEYVPSGYYGGYSGGYVDEPAYAPQYQPASVPQYQPAYVPQYPESQMTNGWVRDQPYHTYYGGGVTTGWVGDEPVFLSQ